MRSSLALARPSATFAATVLGLCFAFAVALPAAAETYGEGIALAHPTPIEAIVADPEAWAGKRVRVEGKVAAVCPMRGCWMELAAGDDGPVVRIKVEDGVIVFPAEAVGRAAGAEGVVKVVEMSREAYLGWLAHLAEERGETFDAEAAGVGDGPFRLIQIDADGAEIAAAAEPTAMESAPAPAAAPGAGEAPSAEAAPAPATAPEQRPASAGDARTAAAPGAGR